MIGSMNAALVPNGDFESSVGTAEGWDVWAGGGTVNAAEYTTGGNPDGYVDLDAAAGTWAGWYQNTPLSFETLGAPAGSTITLQADIKNFGGNLNSAGLKLEGKGGTGTEVAERPGVTTEWATYSVELLTDPTNTGLVFNLMTIPADAGGASTDGFDNCQLIVGRKALFPVPIVDGLVPGSTTELTWINPDPNSPSEPVTATAYLLESDTLLAEDPNLGPDVFDDGVQTLTVTGESADVTGKLLPNKYYYWAVHTADPNAGGDPIVTQGFTWHFEVSSDTTPIVDAGDDQYLVTTGSPMTINLDATVSDDELAGPVTITWTNETAEGDANPNTVITYDPNEFVEDPTLTLTNAVDGEVTGYYQFQISVDDGVWPAVTDQVIIGVYGTCAEAAEGDPDDDWDTTGDLDGNCKKDLADFALLAADWLGCNANRIICP